MWKGRKLICVFFYGADFYGSHKHNKPLWTSVPNLSKSDKNVENNGQKCYYAPKYSMLLILRIFHELKTAQPLYMETLYAKFHPNLPEVREL
jgi:hypothetical protein